MTTSAERRGKVLLTVLVVGVMSISGAEMFATLPRHKAGAQGLNTIPNGQRGAVGATGATGPAGANGTNGTNGAPGLSPLSGASPSIGGVLLTVGSCSTTTMTVTGATVGMAVVATPNVYPGDGSDWRAYVSSANTVIVKVCAIVALTPTASTYNVRVIQ